MDLSVLREMFVNNKKQVGKSVPVGEHYPIPIEHPKERNVLCFVSLSCAHCIELLPELAYFNTNHKEQFRLFVISHEEEATALKEHLAFAFPVYHVDDQQMDQYFVVTTPFLYIVDSTNRVVHAAKFNKLEEMIAEMDAYL